MTPDDFKKRLEEVASGLIDVYFSNGTFMDKMANATLKLVLKSSIGKVDAITPMFTDKEGNINAQLIVDTYAEQIGHEGVMLDLRDFIHNDYLKELLPNKSLKITEADIRKITKEA